MRSNRRPGQRGISPHLAVGFILLLTFVLWRSPLGDGLVRLSYDLPFLFGPFRAPDGIVLVVIDELSCTQLQQPYPQWNRALHAQLLEVLSAAPARLVVFDIYFPESDPRAEDAALAGAIQANGRVILAADCSPIPGHQGTTVSPPLAALRRNARGWGLSLVDPGGVVRWHHPGTEDYPSLPWAAAAALDAPITSRPNARLESDRWIRYYGGARAFRSLSYGQALLQAPDYFRDKIVFVGGSPQTDRLHAEKDWFQTPYSRWGGEWMPGVELEATMLLNLLRNEWLTRMPVAAEGLLLLLGGLVFGYGLNAVRPLSGIVWGGLGALAVGGAGVALVWHSGFWCAWLLIVGFQIPCAWTWAVLSQSRRLAREKTLLEHRLAAMPMGLITAPAPAVTTGPTLPEPVLPPGTQLGPGPTIEGTPAVADHVLLRRIGRGAYGEVYLARNAIGLYDAVKVLHRDDFAGPEPYEREFLGIQRYMPISRNHGGLVHLLHVGHHETEGYFYYVMELADDPHTGTHVNPIHYLPKTLSGELRQRGALPVAECVSLFLPLVAALDYLHRERLVHRDIKPCNIIFVRGSPKFADVGLVTSIAAPTPAPVWLGTRGYLAPEGSGAPSADLYSLGIVLYEAATGLSQKRFPELPSTLPERADRREFLRLNRICLRACAADPLERYRSAAELYEDLIQLETRLRR